MGNTCVGPNLAANGFLQSVSNAVWRTRPPEDLSNAEGSSSKGDNAGSDDAKGSDPVQSTPPETVKIGAESQKAEKSEGNGGKSKKPAHMKRVYSAGLQMDSVLQRKTENIKEIYSLGRKLGQGQFGTTYLCIEKASTKEFACKSIAKRKLTTGDDVEDVRREIQIMHHLAGHPNVIQIVGAFEDAVAVHVVMELCAGGELFDRIIQRGHYTERKAADLARIIVSVVEACHSLGVMHRDLKPENFLFINQQEESPLKTIDFGLSMFFRPGTFLDSHILVCVGNGNLIDYIRDDDWNLDNRSLIHMSFFVSRTSHIGLPMFSRPGTCLDCHIFLCVGNLIYYIRHD